MWIQATYYSSHSLVISEVFLNLKDDIFTIQRKEIGFLALLAQRSQIAKRKDNDTMCMLCHFEKAIIYNLSGIKTQTSKCKLWDKKIPVLYIKWSNCINLLFWIYVLRKGTASLNTIGWPLDLRMNQIACHIISLLIPVFIVLDKIEYSWLSMVTELQELLVNISVSHFSLEQMPFLSLP